MYTFNHEDVLQQVLDFMRSLGIEPADSTIQLDGEIHRFSTRDDKQGQKSGAYCIHSDGWPAGFVQDWRKGIKETWRYDVSGLGNEQRTYFNSEAFKKKCEEDERRASEARKKKHREASEHARLLWDTLKPAPDNHPYLVRKNVHSYSLGISPDTGDLAVPLRGIDGQVRSIQWIPADKDKPKLFYSGASLDGAFFSIDLPESDEYSGLFLLGEGYATMAKVYELTGYPCVAAMSCHKLTETLEIIHNAYPKSKIVIMADNDLATEQKIGRNPGMLHAKLAKKSGLALGISYPPFSAPDEGSDWDDYAILHGDEETALSIKNDLMQISAPKNIQSILTRTESINAQELRAKHFDPVVWAVPGFVPAGFTILGGGPKVGKSLMALHLGLGIATGRQVLGSIDVEQGDVLYLALEDTQRRLQDRINMSDFSDSEDLSRLTLTTQVPRQHEGGLEYIEWWLDEHKNARLVIIDTLQKFRKQLTSKGNMYGEDYDVIAQIKGAADKRNVAFLALHHLKKMNAKEELLGDWINQFSGSAGLSGSADTLLVLKRERTSSRGILRRTGRDVEEKDFSMTLEGLNWNVEGEAEVLTMPAWKKQILDYLKEHRSVTPSELATACGLFLNTAKQNLRRLEKEGAIRKTGYGQYSLPDHES